MTVQPTLTNIGAAIITAILIICGLLCFTAVFAEQLREIQLLFFRIFYVPLQRLGTWCQDALRVVREWLREQAEAETASGDSRHVLYFVMGSLLYACLATIMIYCDFGIVVQSFEAMQFASDIEIVEPATLVAVSIIAATVVWPMLLLDALEVTHLAPWVSKMSPLNRKFFIGICWIGIAMCLTSILSLSYWRADIIVSEFNSEAHAAPVESAALHQVPDLADLDRELARLDQEDAVTDFPPGWIPKVALVSSTFAIVSATGVTTVGMFGSIKWLALGICAIAGLLPLALGTFLTSACTMILGCITEWFRGILDLMIGVGEAILRRFGWQPSEPRRTNTLAADSGEGFRSEALPEEPVPEEAADTEYRPSSAGFNPYGTSGEDRHE